MCFAVFIGTDEELETGEFVPKETDIYFEEISPEQNEYLRSKFSKQYIYYVGSDTRCSCGLNFYSAEFDNPEWQDNKRSPQKFIEFIKERTEKELLEYYCCWEGDWEEDPEDFEEININNISLDKNYFGLTERQFIIFRGIDLE
ncbi:hypothetical protein [Pedobacter sp. SYSU D00535]|uniref:hypothetical protein n=1 Tax=Pedobacter sp. SYSU D00535 TaxID=2810308 RepID=UPI001A959052|nr:hypothetical protein [Pedobacter sp. SYSU D00535]